MIKLEFVRNKIAISCNAGTQPVRDVRNLEINLAFRKPTRLFTLTGTC